MTEAQCPPNRRAAGPRRAAILVLAVAALALVATSPPPPTLETRIIGDVTLGPGEVVERALHISLAAEAGTPTGGSIGLILQAANGLHRSGSRSVTARFVSASDVSGPFEPDRRFPVDRCSAGCELDYRIAVSGGAGTLPGSIVRFEVDVEVQFGGYGALRAEHLRVDLERPASGPVAPIWAVLAGLLALGGGIGAGPAIAQALSPGRRRWPAVILALVPLVIVVWRALEALPYLRPFDPLLAPSLVPRAILYVLEPWTLVLMITLAWGIRRGLRAWPDDGGWLLGLAAIATAGLAGLWLAWTLTVDAAVQPFGLGLVFVALGGLAGVVIGGAWRTDHRAVHDRVPAAFAVVSHGIVIAGFGFLAVQPLFDPFQPQPVAMALVIPAGLVALAFRRWLHGRQGWLIVLDVVVVAVGVLGSFLLMSLPSAFSSGPPSVEIGAVAVGIALAAAIVGLVSSLHRMPMTAPEGAAGPATT